MRSPDSIVRPALFLTLGWLASTAIGCGEPTASPPVSPIVAADSEEGRKAMAEDEAQRQLRKEQEARARSRVKKMQIPEEG